MVLALENETALASHFTAWLNKHVPEDEREQVRQLIVRLVWEHPDLILSHSWPEMRRLAEQSY